MKKRINAKSEKGFTMEDLIIALFVITLLAGLIATTMYSVYETNARATVTAQMTTYAIQILEDIDRIAYEEVDSDLASEYRGKFAIPDGYGLEINVSNYGEGTPNVEDVIKIVNLKISYTLAGESEEFTVTRLKIREA